MMSEIDKQKKLKFDIYFQINSLQYNNDNNTDLQVQTNFVCLNNSFSHNFAL